MFQQYCYSELGETSARMLPDEPRNNVSSPHTESLSPLSDSLSPHTVSLSPLPESLSPHTVSGERMRLSDCWRHLVSGAAAGAVSRTLTAPIDRVKVWLQVHGRSQHECGSLGRCLGHFLREGGFVSLWRGNGVNVLKLAPESALKFMTYEWVKRSQLAARADVSAGSGVLPPSLALHERMLAGSCAGVVSQSCIYPLEVLKTRLVLRRTGDYAGIRDALVSIYRREGLRAFTRGYVPNMLGIVPYAGIDLAVYETLRNRVSAARSQTAVSADISTILVCGTASSTCAQLASYPLALVRTRLQAGSSRHSMRSVIADICRRDGLRGLYHGFLPNFMKVAPSVSISYLVYEKCRTSLGVSMS